MIKNILSTYLSIPDRLQAFPPLLLRWILAYGFYEPAMTKLKNIHGIIDWFTEMGLPFPALNAYLATGTEVVGCICLFLGFGIRFITLPLMITMLVAIKTVHWENGFSAGENGYEIPLYYLIMLFCLWVWGSGKIGLDYILSQKVRFSS